jgi:hypothetical protein
MEINEYFLESEIDRRSFLPYLTSHTDSIYEGYGRVHKKTNQKRTWLDIFNQSYHSLICEFWLIQNGFAPNSNKYSDVIAPDDRYIEIKTVPTLLNLQSQVEYITDKVKQLPVKNDEIWFFHKEDIDGDFKYTLVHKEVLEQSKQSKQSKQSVQSEQSNLSEQTNKIQEFYDFIRDLKIKYYQKNDKKYVPYKNIGGLWNVIYKKEKGNESQVIKALETTYGIHILDIK